MTDRSSLSWSNYGISYKTPQAQGHEHETFDGSLKNETTAQRLENTNRDASAFHRSLDPRQCDTNIQGQADKGQNLRYNGDASFPQHSSASTTPETKKISWEDIIQVKHFVETCIKSYMTKSEAIRALSSRAKIEPSFTHLVWQRLEKENEQFFRSYYIWLKVKEQIQRFNQLLEQQHQLMMMEKTLDIQQPQLHPSKLYSGSHELSAQFAQQGNHLPQNYFGHCSSQVERTMQLPNHSQALLYDSPSMRHMNLTQPSTMPGNGNFSTDFSIAPGAHFSAASIEDFDTNGSGFLHMENLEGMPASLEQLSVPRRASDLFIEFPSNQGNYSGDSLFSSNMNTYINQPFQNTCDDRAMDPNSQPLYDSYGGSS